MIQISKPITPGRDMRTPANFRGYNATDTPLRRTAVARAIADARFLVNPSAIRYDPRPGFPPKRGRSEPEIPKTFCEIRFARCDMSLDRSLKSANALIRHRNVLTRAERLDKLKEEEKWTEGKNSVFGLPKVAHRKMAVIKAVKEETAEGAVAGATATAGAAPATAGKAAPAAAAGAKGAAAPSAGGKAAAPAAGKAAPAAKKK
jgi:small basic protein (TIGR04137 family)